MAITISSFSPSSTPAVVTEGSSLTMTVTASTDSGGALLYQWQIKYPGTSTFVDLSGETGFSYTDSSISATEDGTFYRCLVYTVTPSEQEYAPSATGVEIDVVPASLVLVITDLEENYQAPIGGAVTMEFETSLNGTAASDPTQVGSITPQWQVSTDNGVNWTNVTVGGDISVLTTTETFPGVTPAVYFRRTVLTYNNIPFTENLNQYRVVSTTSLATNSPYTSDATAIIVGADISITKQPGTGGDVTTFVKYNSLDANNTGNTTLEVTASSTAGSFTTLSYQWQFRLDANDSFTPINAYDLFVFKNTGYDTNSIYIYAAEYLPFFELNCVISGTANEIPTTSDTVSLDITQSLVTSKDVVDTTVAEGSTATFDASILDDDEVGTNGAVFSRWQTSTDSGSTWTDLTSYEETGNPTYTTGALTAAASGTLYRVQFDGPDCTNEPFYSPDANGAELTVFSFVTISASPANSTVYNNQIASFAVVATASNSATLTYQWQVSTNNSTWTNITNTGVYSGATTALLLIDPSTTSLDEYYYRCIVNAPNTIASVTSGIGQLFVVDDVFTSISSLNDQDLLQNQALTYTVTAQSASLSAITYQWEKSTNYDPQNPSAATWSNISGQTSATFTVASVSSSDEAHYRCKLTSTGGTVDYTNVAEVTVTTLDITVTNNNGAAVTVLEGVSDSLVLNVTATPSIGSTLTYEWQYNTNSSGNTGWAAFGTGFAGSDPANFQYVPLAFTRSQNGLRVRCKVNGTDIPGDFYSTETVITVNRKFSFIPIPNPINIAGNEYQTLDLGVSTTGGSITYQWQYKTGSSWTNFSDGTNSSVTILGYVASNQLPTAGSTIVNNGNQVRCLVTVSDASQYEYFTQAAGLTTTGISNGAQVTVNPTGTATVSLQSAVVENTKYSFETSKVGAAIGTIMCIPKPGGYTNPGTTGGDDCMSWNKPHSSVATSSNANKLKYDSRFVGWIPVSADPLASGDINGASLDASEFPELARIIGNTFGGSLNTYTSSVGFLPPKSGTNGTSGGMGGTFALPLIYGKKLFGTGNVNNNGASTSVITRFDPKGASGSLNQVGYIGGEYNYDQFEQLPPGSNLFSGSTQEGVAGTTTITPATFTIGSFKTEGWENVSADIATTYSESISWSIGPISEKELTTPTQHQHAISSYAAAPASETQLVGKWHEVSDKCNVKSVTPTVGTMIEGVPFVGATANHKHGLSFIDASADGKGHSTGGNLGGVGSQSLSDTYTAADTGSFVSNGQLVMTKQSNTLWNSNLKFKLINAERLGIITPQFRLKYYIKAW